MFRHQEEGDRDETIGQATAVGNKGKHQECARCTEALISTPLKPHSEQPYLTKLHQYGCCRHSKGGNPNSPSSQRTSPRLSPPSRSILPQLTSSMHSIPNRRESSGSSKNSESNTRSSYTSEIRNIGHLWK
jgi:hypothetical protein